VLVLVVVVVVAVVVVAIALVAVGRVTAELAQAPPRSYFDEDEAVVFVADRLSEATTAVLSYDDVAAVIGWHLDYLEGRGVASEVGPEQVAGPVVADEDEALAVVLGRADEAGLEISDEQVVEVLHAVEAYLVAIGAIGEAVPPPVDPLS
jgi:hypothetical protein